VNHYKIDYNKYADIGYPYALYGRKAWSWRWEHIKSFATTDEAKALHRKLTGLPIHLD
jgi:hypothetical protein